MLPLILLKVLFWLDEFALSDGCLVAVLRLLLDCWILGMRYGLHHGSCGWRLFLLVLLAAGPDGAWGIG